MERFFTFVGAHYSKNSHFVYREGSVVQFCTSSKTAVRLWNGSTSLKKLIQVYIAPLSLTLNKLRVHWSAQTGPTCFQIKRHAPELFAQHQPPRPRQQHVYLHKMSEFKYAGKLYKSSFSLSDPCPPLFPAQSSASQPTSRQVSSISQPSDYFIRFHDRDPSLEEVECPASVSSMMNELLVLLTSVVPHRKNKGIVEFAADFECDQTQKWNFLSCKTYRTDYVHNRNARTRGCILPRHNDISTLLISQLNIVSPLEPEDIQERLSHLQHEVNKLNDRQRRIYVPRHSAFAFNPSQAPRLPEQQPRREEFDRYVGQMCCKLDRARSHYLAPPGRSLIPTLKYQRFCRLLFEALDEHEDLQDYSKNLEKSVQFWSLDSRADLRFVLTYITERLRLPPNLFSVFFRLATDLCVTVGFSNGATQFIKDVLTVRQNASFQ